MSLMSSFKGIVGETVINVAMWLKLEKDIYHRLNNITLPLAEGGSTQIDHVIVSRYGIFVIETKNYKGWIFGNEKQRQWTQVIMGRKYKFQNPLRQNYLHIKTLSDLLELEMSNFHSMIAFIGECELKTRDELPEYVLTSGMASYIKKKQDKMLTDEEVKAIVEQIENNRFSKSWRTNRAHKAYLKEKHNPSNKQPLKTTILQSREVLRWSGQTDVEAVDVPIVSSSKVLPISQLNNDNSVFITPFEVLESETKIEKSATREPSIIEPVEASIISDNTPACPKCNGEMVKRVAKKGQQQDQTFFGCSQFPKCRGMVNVD
ncbi:MAG TPA: DNA topoisomerase I [Psychrobacter sp.]|nr:DNA topoisomerase I [Psychrobacter sp.]